MMATTFAPIRGLWPQGILLALVAIGACGFAALAGNTYLNDLSPNPSVTEPDCYAFDITVTQASGSSATLALRVEDVDEEDGELDEVYLNGSFLGYLTGTNGEWSTTTFNITNQINYSGTNGVVNEVRICIDPDGGESSDWRATIDWGQILTDGGSAEDAEITSVDASGDWSNIRVDVGIRATNEDDYRLEINLLDSGNDNKDIAVDTFHLNASQSTTRTNYVSLPSEPSGGETLIVQALLFNDTTGVQQNVMETTWTSSSEPPTGISLSNDAIDENLPPNSLVGTLTATDPDSASHTFTLIGGDLASFNIVGDELRTAASFDHEANDTYSLRIEAEDDDTNTYNEWFTIAVDDVNEAPVAGSDSATVNEGSSVAVSVLSNDSDPDVGDSLHVASVTTPSQGTAAIMGDAVRYTPNPGACGPDSFEYTVEDGGGAQDTAIPVNITITNVAPSATDDSAETPESTPILIDALANDADAGGVMTLGAIGPPAHGTAVAVGNEIRYTPDARYEGSDRFSYVVEDPCGASSTGWVDLAVLRVNNPPTANAGIYYQGVVGQPVELSAQFSSDPDTSDRLEYRWDLDNDGRFDTDWLSDETYLAVYESPYVGRLVLEVRDLYRGQPTGDTDTDEVLIRVDPIGAVQVLVYEDLDGDGLPSDGEPGVPGVEVTLGEATATTAVDGRFTFETGPGAWTATVAESAVLSLEARAYAVPVTSQTVQLGGGENAIAAFAVAKTSTRLKGVVYADVNENGELDDEDRLVEGVLVMLDGDAEGAVTTDAAGAFAFRDVLFGAHEIYVEAVTESDDESPPSLLVPFTLSRTEKALIQIDWPYVLGPEEGFLQVDVQRGEGGTP